MFGLAAPVNSGSDVDADTDVDAAVGVAIGEVMFEIAFVAVGPTKVAGKLTLNDNAHA